VLYVRSSITCSVTEPLIGDANCLKCCFEGTSIVAIYRSPSYEKLDRFFSGLDNIIQSINSTNLVVIGDINIDIKENNTHPYSEEYLNLMASLGLLPAHSLPTRDGNCLDHVMLKTKLSSKAAVLQAVITDHYPVVLSLKLKNTCLRPSLNNFINYINHDGVKTELNSTNFNTILDETNPEFAASNLIAIINSVINNHKEKKRVSRKFKIIKPWITSGLLRCIRNRDSMHQKLKKDPDNYILKTTYNRYRNFCNSLLKKIKIAYEKGEFEKAKNNPKEMWNVVKTVTNTKRHKRSPEEILRIDKDARTSIDSVNRFFVNIGKNLASKFPLPTQIEKTNCYPPTVSMVNSFVILPISETEVERLIMSLRSDCALGWDDIPARVLKQSCNTLVKPLTHVLNLCITKGVFPSVFKRAVVHPIHKGGDRDLITNYRPISVLTPFSKILERYLNKSLKNYLEKHGIISDNQFGFRSHKSTEDAVSKLVETLVVNTDAKRKCYGIFLDLTKAFDTVSIAILLSKLETLGIRGIPLDMFTSYLTNRTQSVKIGSVISSEEQISYGVPQGSILGPTLFLLYINNLCNMYIDNCTILSYADDTALVVHGDCWVSARRNAEGAIRTVLKWLSDNLLTLNLSKTRLVRFDISKSKKYEPNSDHVIAHTCSEDTLGLCGCEPLEMASSVKYLGVHVDAGLDWHIQIKAITERTRKLIYIFKNLRNSADRCTLLTIYFGLCQSVISYCIPVWGGADKTSMLKLERAQRAILKVITCKKRTFPTKELYAECEVLTVRQLAVLRLILRRHQTLPFDLVTAARRRGAMRACPIIRCRTAWANRQHSALSAKLYNTINNTSHIYSLAKYEVKNAVQKLLATLSYNETEELIK
jgi:hypothetical protein